MAGEPVMTVVGNLTRDPEVRMAGEHPVCRVTIASTPRRLDRQSNQWVDGETLFLEAEVWGPRAYELEQDAFKGTSVIALVELKTQTWNDRQTNEKKSKLVGKIIEIGLTVTPPRRDANQGRSQAPRQAPVPHQETDRGWQPVAPPQAPAPQAQAPGPPPQMTTPTDGGWPVASIPPSSPDYGDDVPF